jgi:hypothetical protein
MLYFRVIDVGFGYFGHLTSILSAVGFIRLVFKTLKQYIILIGNSQKEAKGGEVAMIGDLGITIVLVKTVVNFIIFYYTCSSTYIKNNEFVGGNTFFLVF